MITVKECYESMEADFEGVIGRMGSEEMVKRFAFKMCAVPKGLTLVISFRTILNGIVAPPIKILNQKSFLLYIFQSISYS